MLNKNKYKKANEKKVLHKVKKQWVVLGTAAFALLAVETAPDAFANHSSLEQTVNAAIITSNAASGADSSAVNGTSTSSPVATASTSSTVVTSSVASTSVITATPVEDDGISFRDGDGDQTPSTPTDGSSVTNASLTTKNPYEGKQPNTASMNTSSLASNGSSYAFSASVTESGNTEYHATTNIYAANDSADGNISYTNAIKFANDNHNNAPLNSDVVSKISNLVAYRKDAVGSVVNITSISQADISSYVHFVSSTADANLQLVYGTTASSTSVLLFNLPADYLSSHYSSGEQVGWSFDLSNASNANYSANNAGDKTAYPSTNYQYDQFNYPVTFNFVDANGNPISNAPTQYLTGDNIYNGNTFAVTTPSLSGYTPAYSTISGNFISGASNSNGEYVLNGVMKTGLVDSNNKLIPQSITLKYNSAKSYSGNVTLTDVNNDKNPISLGGITFSGAVGDKTNYNTQSAIDSLVAKGYKLTSSSQPIPQGSAISVNASNNDYTYDFVHATQTYSAGSTDLPSNVKEPLTSSVARTINFVAVDTQKSVANPVTQTVTYDRTATYDQVTSSASYSDWQAAGASQFDAVTAPAVAGYKPATASYAAVANPNDNVTENDIYTKNEQPQPTYSGAVTFTDMNDAKQPIKIISDYPFTGTLGESIDYNVKSAVDSLTAEGYKLTTVSQDAPTSITVNPNDNNYNYTFIHATQTYAADAKDLPSNVKEPLTSSVTKTINFVASGTNQAIATPITQTITYDRSATYDQVTKAVSYSEWTTANSQYPAYPAPAISGYTNPQPQSIAAENVTSAANATNTSVNIIYSKTVAPSNWTPSYITPTTPAASSASATSDAPISYYSVASSATSSDNASSAVSISSASSYASSSSASSVAISGVKMYNYKTSLIKSAGQIQIFIEPKYAPTAANGSLGNQFVVNRQAADGIVTHDQQLTLDQYNAMLSASGKQTYTPATLEQAYRDRSASKGVMKVDAYKTTFDAKPVQRGNSILIDTDTVNNGFNKPADNQLVKLTDTNRAKVNHAKHKTTKHPKTKHTTKKHHAKLNHKKVTHKHAKATQHVKHDHKRK